MYNNGLRYWIESITTHTTTLTYDAASNVTQVQKPDGKTNRVVYDRVNRCKR